MTATPQEIKEAMIAPYKAKLFIERLPKDVRDQFTTWAKEQFCDDYGMALTFLWKLYTPMADGYEKRLLAIEARLSAIESPKEEPKEEKKSIRMCDGRTVEVGKNGQ